MENVGVYYDHVEYFTAIWYNLWPFVKNCGHLVFFPTLLCLDREKSGNPAADRCFHLNVHSMLKKHFIFIFVANAKKRDF
jgi:hypothetical protein